MAILGFEGDVDPVVPALLLSLDSGDVDFARGGGKVPVVRDFIRVVGERAGPAVVLQSEALLRRLLWQRDECLAARLW